MSRPALALPLHTTTHAFQQLTNQSTEPHSSAACVVSSNHAVYGAPLGQLLLPYCVAVYAAHSTQIRNLKLGMPSPCSQSVRNTKSEIERKKEQLRILRERKLNREKNRDQVAFAAPSRQCMRVEHANCSMSDASHTLITVPPMLSMSRVRVQQKSATKSRSVDEILGEYNLGPLPADSGACRAPV